MSPQRTEQKALALRVIDQALGGGFETEESQRTSRAQRFAVAISDVSRDDTAQELGALKIYKIPSDANGEKARQRFAREVESLQTIVHPNLLQLITASLDGNWMITKYYPSKTLDQRRDFFRNRPLEALIAFRGLVEGVAQLHSAHAVHRDIKPANIFVTSSGELVLGDFGIVFIEEGKGKRVTETFERVGTRDWMPAWAHMGMRVDDVKPSFDVCALGKVLWAMLSGQEFLPREYYKRPQFDLTALFPHTPAMSVINESLLSACIVEDEDKCLPNAMSLLAQVDVVLDMLRRDRQLVGNGMRCQVCSSGTYDILLAKPQDQTKLRLISLPTRPDRYPDGVSQEHLIHRHNLLQVRVYRCHNCGHLALFQFPDGEHYAAWQGRL